MNQFSLVLEFGRPVAALVPTRLPAAQLVSLLRVMPPAVFDQPELATRWNLAHVFACPEWSRDQKRRVPMTAPKQTLKLAFV
jgi:hypothetical protein